MNSAKTANLRYSCILFDTNKILDRNMFGKSDKIFKCLFLKHVIYSFPGIIIILIPTVFSESFTICTT